MKKPAYLISVILLIFNCLSLKILAQQRITETKTLPFSEDWQSGDYTTNNWQINSEMISVITSVGNESPSLRFHKPTYLNEVLNLTSDTIDATSNKIGHIFLTFDLMHSTDFPPAIDYFIIQISNGLNWISIDSIPRHEEFVWFSYKYDLADFALNKKFKIRFQTTGEESEYSWSWYLDNIEVYTECDPPIELEGEVYFSGDTLGSLISWKAPLFEGWKHWDNTDEYGGIGLNLDKNFEYPITAAIRFDDAMLNDIVGDTVKSIRFYTECEFPTDFKLKAWKENSSNLIISDTIQNVPAEEWSIHHYSDPIIINDTSDYFFGYQVSFYYEGNGFILSTDLSPGVVGYGDLFAIYEDSLESMSIIGMHNNFHIQILANKKSQLNTSNLMGFNVYAMYTGETEYNKIRYVEFDESNFNYSILDTCYTEICDAFYKVEAVWQYGGETCYSDYARSLLFPEDDFVFILYENIDENNQIDFVKIYPNPVSDLITIEAQLNINNIMIYNALGRLVFDRKIPLTNISTINISELDTGVYVMKIKSEKKIQTIRFIKI